MKIDQTGKPFTPAASSSRPGQGKTIETEGRPASATAPADSVELKSSSLKLAALESGLGSQPAIDSAKVDEIRQAIADGRFRVNPDAIADKLVASVKELLAGRKDG